MRQLRRRLAQLKRSLEKYRQIFEGARDVIILFDLKGNVTAANRAVEEYGFTEEDLVGTNLLKFVPKGSWPRLLRQLAQVTKGSSVDGEIELLTPKGKRIAEYRSNPLRVNGKVVGFQAILRDVTERKRLEERLAAFSLLGHKLVLFHKPEEIVQAAVEAAHRVFQIESCRVWLVDESQRTLLPIGPKGVSASRLPPVSLDGQR